MINLGDWAKGLFGRPRQIDSGALFFAEYWKLDAGLRYLRMIDPDYAEYDYAFNQEERRQKLALIEAGTLKQNGDYNVVRREVTGRKRYITYFSGGSGRSWKEEIPEGYRNLPVIEPVVREPASLNAVHDYVSGVANGLSNETGKQALSRLQAIKANRAQLLLPSDLSPMTVRSTSALEARQRAQTAVLIMDFFDNVSPLEDRLESGSHRIENFGTRLRNAYNNAGLNGALYWPVLLLLEIAQTGMPAWPFGGQPRFVCGQSNCGHAICRKNLQRALARTEGLGMLTSTARDFHVYLLENEADLTEVLRLAINSGGNPGWIEQASMQLLNRGKSERSKLAVAQSALDFYTVHFRYLPYFRAAQIGFSFLAFMQNERQGEFQALSNEAEEFGARAIAALGFDFANAVDQLPVLTMREQYSYVAAQSRMAANAMLESWIENETLMPAFWRNFVAGEIEGLSFHANAGGSVS
jgi:hypothetical protein